MDKRDNKLLEMLEINCRTPLKDLSKELHVSKQAVHNRLKELEKETILSYFTVINYFQMGYNNLHLYLKIQGLDESNYYRKLKELDKIKNVGWIADFIGDFDLGLSVYYKSVSELELVLRKIYKVFNKKIRRKQIYLISEQLSPINNSKNLRRDCIRIKKNEEYYPSLTELDINILKKIQSSARFNYVDVSEKVGITRRAVKNRIKYLEKTKVILGYKPLFNYNSLGYLWNICILKVFPGIDRAKILNSLLSSNGIPFISITVDGDILFDLKSRSYSEMKSFINHLKLKHESDIEEYILLNVNKLYKFKDI